MTHTEQNDTKELRKLAEAASKGLWFAADWKNDFGSDTTTVEYREPKVLREGQSSIWPSGIACRRVAKTEEGERPLEDAAYIAAVNPAAILALLDRLERAEADLAAEKRKTLELSRVYEERGRQIERLELRDSRAEAALNAGRVNLNAGAKEAAAGAVPAGFKLMPLEPTPEIINALRVRYTKADATLASLYRDALAAAPSAPVAAQGLLMAECSTCEVIYGALRSYHMTNMNYADEDGGGNYPLVDLLTPDGCSIAEGEEQMRYIADDIVEAIAAHLRTGAQYNEQAEAYNASHQLKEQP